MRPSRIALFFAAHVPLALWMAGNRQVSTAHGVLVFLVGLWWAWNGKHPERLAWLGAYIAGAEVLWRMTDSLVYWEFAKYAISALFLLAVLRGRGRRLNGPALLYFALLLPSALFTLAELPWLQARGQISFNLAGPLTLTMTAWFFSNLKLGARGFRRLLLAPLGPLLGVATVAISFTVRATALEFTQESNYTTSGGFGPNQVGAALGLGAFLALFYLLHGAERLSLQVVVFAVLLVLATQSALTFSRAGLINAAGAAALATLYLVRERGPRARILQLAPLLFLAGAYLILPRLDEFTGGAISARFQDTSMGARSRLLAQDLRVWQEHPIFGVGPGMAKSERDTGLLPPAAHTEFSRLLSEHGLFGLAALGLLALMLAQRFHQARSPTAKAMVLSMMGWGLLFMMHSGMRLAAPGFLFGLGFASPRFRMPPAVDPAPAAEPSPQEVTS